jgi:hypothetical protein
MTMSLIQSIGYNHNITSQCFLWPLLNLKFDLAWFVIKMNKSMKLWHYKIRSIFLQQWQISGICTRNHYFFDLGISIKQNPIWFFPPWPNYHFGQVVSNLTILTRSFWLVFLTRCFLLNHCDNIIIWAMTKK